jgi:hypothetical protein
MNDKTITRAEFEAACNAASCGSEGVRAIFAAAGITIADPAPPEAMVKLAREIVRAVPDGYCGDPPTPYDAALAALQHVEKGLLELPGYDGGLSIERTAALKIVGAA